jgi:hypothetical protein
MLKTYGQLQITINIATHAINITKLGAPVKCNEKSENRSSGQEVNAYMKQIQCSVYYSTQYLATIIQPKFHVLLFADPS